MAEFKIIKITKKSTGVTYIYEDRPYWDKENKRPAHERRCIGKIDKDGKIIYNKFYKMRQSITELREATTTALKNTKSDKSPCKISQTVLRGEMMILDKIDADNRISECLQIAFKEDSNSIMALSQYMVCKGKALCHAQPWLDDRGKEDLELSSQNISRLLGRISQDKINVFFSEWIQCHTTEKKLLFDISSISSYAGGISYIERGYNRDKESLEQLNIGIFSTNKGLPLMYTLMPGSMSDVAVLSNVSKMAYNLGLNNYCLYGDRGFYSAANIEALDELGIRYTIPVPSGVSWSRNLIAEHRKELVHPDNVITEEIGEDNHSVIYGMTVDYKGKYCHIYFDPTRKDKVIANHMLLLRKCKDDLESGKVIKSRKAYYEKYFIVTELEDGSRRVLYNAEAIEEYTCNDSCYWVLLSNEDPTAEIGLANYRLRNNVEIDYDDIKNHSDLKRLRCHSDITVRGKLFINFIAEILLQSMRNIVKSVPAKDRRYWSETEMLERVITYSTVKFSNNKQSIDSQPTAGQRMIFDIFGIDYQKTKKTTKSKSI